MDTIPFVTAGYSTATFILTGLFATTLFLGAIISLIYWINTRIRRGMKASRDDWREEQMIETGHTLHAEGIYGKRHSDEGGMHLQQEDPHSALDALKPGLKKIFKPTSGQPRTGSR